MASKCPNEHRETERILRIDEIRADLQGGSLEKEHYPEPSLITIGTARTEG